MKNSLAEIVLTQSEIIRGQQVIIDRLFTMLASSDIKIDDETLKQIKNYAAESLKVL